MPLVGKHSGPGAALTFCATVTLLWGSTAAAQPPTRFEIGRQHWQSRRYAQAYPPLIDVRNHINSQIRSGRVGQSLRFLLNLDYMLATSACRTPGAGGAGQRRLQNMLRYYPLPQSAKETIERERSYCMSAGTHPAPPDRLAVSLTGTATISGSFKDAIGYSLNAELEVVQAYAPLDVPEETLLNRRVELGQRDRYRAALGQTAPPGSGIFVRSRFGYVSLAGHSSQQVDEIDARLERFLTHLSEHYGLKAPGEYMTVYLLRSQSEIPRFAAALHGASVTASLLGYSSQEDLAVVAVVPDARTGTLLHEVFHIVSRSAHGFLPPWLDEGIASLYEAATPAFRGAANWRGRLLMRAWSARPTLEQLIRTGWFETPRTEMWVQRERAAFEVWERGLRRSETGGTLISNTRGPAVIGPDAIRNMTETENVLGLATARYFAMFLDERGQLRPVLDSVVNAQLEAVADGADFDIRTAVERVTGPVGDLESEFERWFMALERVHSEERNAVFPLVRGLAGSQ